MADPVVIRAENIWKRYGLPLPESIRKILGGPELKDHFALRNITFEVRRGETLGIIGHNGAGKSTLLKILAGVTPPTRGRVAVTGTVFPMIELSAGLHMELTGRENVRLLGALMGFARRDIDAHIPTIEDFCELGEWFDMPVRMYSSGMLVRLGFGVAINVNASILLIDEVLAVGDLPFQRKCYAQFEKLRRQGASIIFVSHNIRQVERICDRVLYLKDGAIEKMGDPEEVCLFYHQVSSAKELGTIRKTLPDIATWQGSGELTVVAAEILDGHGSAVADIAPLSPLRIRISYASQGKIERPIVTIRILTDDMMRVAAFSTGDDYPGEVCFAGEGWFEAGIDSINLLQGVYAIGLTVKGSDGRVIYVGDNLAFFGITYASQTKNSFGLVHINARWKFPSSAETAP